LILVVELTLESLRLVTKNGILLADGEINNDQLSLAIPLWLGTISTAQRAVTPCDWRVKAGMVRVWVAGKLCDSFLQRVRIARNAERCTS